VVYFYPGELALLLSWTGKVLVDVPPVLILSSSKGRTIISGSSQPCYFYSVWTPGFLIDRVEAEWLTKVSLSDENL